MTELNRRLAAETRQMREELQGGLIGRLETWAFLTPTWLLSVIFTVLSLLGLGRDVLEGTVGLIPGLGSVIDLVSAIGLQVDESFIAVPWTIIVLELLRRFRKWWGSGKLKDQSA